MEREYREMYKLVIINRLKSIDNAYDLNPNKCKEKNNFSFYYVLNKIKHISCIYSILATIYGFAGFFLLS